MSDLTDYPQAFAEAHLDKMGMNLQIRIEEEYNDEVELGKVIRTEPVADTSLQEGQEIVLYVSLGMEIKTGYMPNVLDISEESARQTLERQGLKLEIKIEEVFDPDIQEGNVVRSDPEKGDPLQTGQVVTLYISKGPETAEMPDLVGKDLDTATSLLEYAGFPEPIVNYVYSEEEAETVLGQSVKAGTEAEISTQVTLEVSKGPEPTEPTAVTKNVTIDLRGYTNDGDCTVVIYCNTKEVFNATVAQGTTAIELANQTGTGMQKYTVIINDSETWDEWVDFS